jgi:hypothetical protein
MDTYRSSIIPREQSLLEQGEAAREQEAIDVEVIHPRDCRPQLR